MRGDVGQRGRMAAHLRTLLVAVTLTLAIGLISGGRWPHYVIGALAALTLWVMLSIDGSAKDSALVREVPWTTYAMGAGITVVLGSVLYLIGNENGAWWGAAIIMAGSLMWPTPRKSASSDPGPEVE